MKAQNGAAEGIRTPDPRITNAVLYQLSYRGINDLAGLVGFFAPFLHPAKESRPAKR